MNCSVERCDRPRHARGVCRTHYMRLKRTGTTDRQTREQRFWANVDVRGDDECWPWSGNVSHWGYGAFDSKGAFVSTRAHVVAFTLTVGPVPSGLVLDHTCHKPDGSCPGGSACKHRLCCNPRHLEPVTHGENVRRGLSVKPHGSRGKYNYGCRCDLCREAKNRYDRDRRRSLKEAA